MNALGSLKFGSITIKILANSEKATVAELHFQPGDIASVHMHPHEEFNYVVKGEFECLSEGEIVRLSAGDVIQVISNHEHNLHCIGDEPGVIVTFWTPSRQDLIEKMS